MEPPRYDHRRLERLATSLVRPDRGAEAQLSDHRKLVKDREGETSQLNRLDWLEASS